MYYTLKLAVLAVVTFALFGARAQQGVDYIVPRIPTEAEKIEALKLAYKLNGNSMVGSQMIDLSGPDLPKADKALPQKLEDMTPAEDAIWPKLERRVREAQVSDTCTRHGMRKVITEGGRSWRCRR